MESWPVVVEEFRQSPAEIRQNLERARRLMRESGCDALVVTSADRYLNEYTPRIDNHRYWLSGFTGSTALLLVPADGRARLYVDGRYHIQADLEVEAAVIEVVKVPFGKTISQALIDDMRRFAVVGCEGDRLSQSFRETLEKEVERLVVLDGGELRRALEGPTIPAKKPLIGVETSVSGRNLEEKLALTFAAVPEPDTTVLLLSALDDIAWLTDCRGYHFLYQSSFAATGFATRQKVQVCIDEPVLRAGPPARAGLEWTSEPIETLLAARTFDGMKTLQYDAGQVTAAQLERIRRQRPQWKLRAAAQPIVALKATKTAAEIAHFEAINRRSAAAIAEAIRWVRRSLRAGREVSEQGFYEAANAAYAAQGARDLSFHTIAAIGADTAIIHFSSPSAAVKAGRDDLMLLDSGALYEGGYATDITRSFIAGGREARPSPRQKEIYTLVAKGLFSAQSAIFPRGTRGAYLDALARKPLFDAGYDYAHGTGHGVGIHVHEPGVGLSPTSTLSMLEGQISSIEPGLYVEGFGGVRIENVVVFEKHPEKAGFLRSRPLNYIGLDEHLIDRDRLDPVEKRALDAYQAECERRGTRDLDG